MQNIPGGNLFSHQNTVNLNYQLTPKNPIPQKSAAKPEVIDDHLQTTPEQVFLREILNEKGYNLSRVSRELAISKASVSRLLHGKIKQTNTIFFGKLLSLYCFVCCRQA